MTRYADLTAEEQRAELARLREEHAAFKARGLALNMARGKPSAAQLDLSMPLLDAVGSSADLMSEDGIDCRNYGVMDGIPEAKRLMAALLDDDPENVMVLGSSSLTALYDAVARCLDFGTGGEAPWSTLPAVKWLCPVPGYDRHFAICEAFGIEMIPVPTDEHGPAMDLVEQLVAEDAAIKGIWCVPKYSNPGGITYSDEVVRRLAAMECAAPDFRIFWDNAYAVHHLADDPAEQDQVLDIADACVEAGVPDRYLKFASTSKVTFPGAGVAAMAASPEILAETRAQMAPQVIGYDKINQLRHVRFLRDADGIAAHMRAHAAVLRPKFALVQEKLHAALDEAGIATWSDPRGGYFVSFDGMPGTAARTVALAREAGVTLTGAGATWPYGRDPEDANIRIAPTLPPLEELGEALDVFACCAKIAALEQLLEA
ncbi:MAG: aminotransferase class I/II-fold pyridoxal phosphate-dependent enzyme [Eggerthellaceae bacterium]|jgi:DNA-binding transcriptional MocR family regulator|nr:aminotransferase class I/II-fold pyridoxal phosphate-dependent enzyme [Eggerthellaceae bacterium]